MKQADLVNEQGGGKMYDLKFWVKIFIGPILFFLVQSINIAGLEANGRFALALYVWIIAWWIGQPIPWGITALLPLIVLPLTGLMGIKGVAALYGQRLIFFHMGVLMFGYIVHKSGLGKRIALYFLNIRWVGTSTYRIILVYLTVVALISAFVDDAAAIAMAIPIGMAVIDYATTVTEKLTGKEMNVTKLKAFMALGVLYASEAGGIMTVAGIPHIAVGIGILEETVGISINFGQWFVVGFFLGIASLLIYFFVLMLFFKPEVKSIPGAQEYFAKEKASIGPMTRAELNTLIVFVVMLILWIVPVFIPIKYLSIWEVPIIGLFILYALPVDKNEHTATVKDLGVGLPWNVMLLALAGGVMASLSASWGVIEWVQSLIPTTLNGLGLAFGAGFSAAGLSNFISGVATTNIMSGIFYPVAEAVGFNPAILARVIPLSSVAIMLPWAGAATAIAFSYGVIKITDMIKVGFVATILHVIIGVLLSYLLVPLFGAFTIL